MLFRRILRSSPIAALLVALPLALSGCKQATPEERLKEAQSLIGEQRQIPLGILKLKELIKESPDDPASIDARFMLAEVYMSLGRKDQMESAFNELKEVYTKLGLKDQRGIDAHQFASQVLFAMEEKERAMQHAAEGEAGVEEPEAKTAMGFLLAQMRLAAGNDEDKAKAEAFFKETSLNATDAVFRGQAREMVADYYRRSGRFEESNAVYDAYMAKFPEDELNAQIILAKALNYRLAKDEAQFEALFKQGADMLQKQIDGELNPGRKAQMQRDTARLFEVAGKVDQAEAQLRAIMAENTGKLPALEAQITLGQMFARVGQLDKSKEIFQAIARDNAGSPMAQEAEQFLAAIDQRVAELATAAADAATSPGLTQTPVPPAGE